MLPARSKLITNLCQMVEDFAVSVHEEALIHHVSNISADSIAVIESTQPAHGGKTSGCGKSMVHVMELHVIPHARWQQSVQNGINPPYGAQTSRILHHNLVIRLTVSQTMEEKKQCNRRDMPCNQAGQEQLHFVCRVHLAPQEHIGYNSLRPMRSWAMEVLP